MGFILDSKLFTKNTSINDFNVYKKYLSNNILHNVNNDNIKPVLKKTEQSKQTKKKYHKKNVVFFDAVKVKEFDKTVHSYDEGNVYLKDI